LPYIETNTGKFAQMLQKSSKNYTNMRFASFVLLMGVIRYRKDLAKKYHEKLKNAIKLQ